MRWAAGVFEGGGAKGALYGPALQAVDEHGIRFVSVAGSSAGALTAAMVAAGCTPEEIKSKTLEALNILAPPRFKRAGLFVAAIRGLRLEPPHVRPIKKVEELLEEILRTKLGIDMSRQEPVTFAELQERGGIELFIVAVDAVGRQEFIFHHELHPDEGVANAATASAAIPIYFPPGQLTNGGKPYSAILFDGGVWSNFPTWIYKDPSFRVCHRLPEMGTGKQASKEDPLVLGLLLDEREPPVTTGTGGSAEDSVVQPTLMTRVRRLAGRLLLAAVLAFTSPLYLFGLAYFLAAVGSTVGCMVTGGLFCDIRSGLDGRVADVIFVLILVLVAFQLLFRQRSRSGVFISREYGAAEVLGSIVSLSFITLGATIAGANVETGGTTLQGGLGLPSAIGDTTGIIGGLALIIAGIVSVLALASVAFFAPAAQGIGRKIMFVLTSAGSARYWVGSAADDYVVRIPVKGLDTLSFREARSFLDTHADAVRSHVAAQLQQRLPNNSPNDGEAAVRPPT